MTKVFFLNCFLWSSIRRPLLYHVITGCGNPAAPQSNVTFCFSLTVTEEGCFVIKYGNSEKEVSFVSIAIQEF